MSKPVATGKMAENRVEPAVLWKLIIFAVLMAVVPIGTYFGSLHFIWGGSTTYSAISAVVAANIVLVGYVWAAFVEDAQPATAPPPRLARSAGQERKKER